MRREEKEEDKKDLSKQTRRKRTGRGSTTIGGGEEGGDTTMDGGMRAKEGEDTTMDDGMGAKEDTVEEDLRESDRKDAAQSSRGSVAEFDYLVENFFAWMDAIGDLCGMPTAENFDASEIERFSSMVTFLEEWKFFHYEPKVINFTYEQAKDLPKDVKLPQFSAASVPKMVELPEARKQCHSTDFILHAGGLVWALDWCPGNHGNQDSKIKCEYLAVAAHPPSSVYHKIGAPLIGRGVIQIWCLLNLDEDIEIPITRTRGRGRPRKKPVEQKPDADNAEVSATPMPRGRPRKYPAKEKPTAPRPRGRPRKRPASSSDEENITPTRSQGRHKKLMSSALDQNDLEDLSLQNLIGAPEKNLVTISSGGSTSSSRKPRGRPRKHPLPVIIDVDEEDTPALDNDGITSTLDGHSAKDSLVTISCGDSASSSRKPRGRPQKHPLPDIIDVREDIPALDNNSITSTLDMHSAKKSLVTVSSGDSASSARKPRGRPRKHLLPATIDVNDQETPPPPNNNGIPSTVDIIVPLYVDSRKDSVDLPISSSIECQDQLIQPRLRERQIKNPVQSAHFSDSSSLVPGNNDVILPSEHGTTDSKELSFCSRNEILGTGDNVLPLSESQNNSLSCPVFATRKSKEELAQHRGKCMKKPISLNDSASQALVELQDDATLSPNLSVCGASDGGQELPASSNHEKFKSGESILSVSIESQNNSKGESNQCRSRGRPRKGACLKLDGSEHVQIAVLRKDSEMYEPVDKGQKKLESSPLDVKERREEKKDNIEGHDCENPILSEFCKEHKADYMPTHENQCDNPVVGSSESIDKSISQAESVSAIPQDLALPRVAFCLAHNGKVAWDLKWRPATANAACKERMGYLAVLLGNGSLEVWEVPIPGIVKNLFTSSYHKEADPRFLKITPVFRCSKVKRGDKQSIPLTMEWSPSFPHDLILAGCHDGTVILWKFSTDCSSDDTKPLLCFIADSTPIRSLAWAPNASELESNNLFVAAGHEGLKFWDIRDPYRALWEVNPVQRAVLSLDWVNDTRCIVMTLDDGTMKILSLCNAASDIPITGKPFAGSKYQGLHSYSCSSFAIWSIHVSRTTGFAAYCCADGSTIRFQLTAKSVDKDPRRNRMPHFLCGSLLAEGGTLRIHTPLPNAPLSQVPFTQKKPSNDRKNSNSSIQIFSAPCSEDNQGPDQASTVEGQGILVIKKDEGSKEEFEVFPPKIVAMHRVRWNMNKGSERWLCYGGAAGVVRCQRINLL